MCGCAVVLMSQTAWGVDWKKIAKGLHTANLGDVQIIKIDPQRYRLSIATAPELNQTMATAQEFAQKTGAILAINGGFFSPEQKSIGLLLRDGKKLNPIHNTHWWAIFYLSDYKAGIVPPEIFHNDPKMEIAIQVGPRLVVQGLIPKLKPSEARRSGIGIQADGNIIIAVTKESRLAIQEFAKFFQQLDCPDALNLDGGSSTQLYLNWKGFKLDIPGLTPVTNAITIFPR